MAGNTVKEMTTNFGKLDKFEERDFRRWQKKMHFLLTTLKVVYVLTTPIPELMEDDTNAESAKELWDSLESKYMAEDASSKKFLVKESLRAHDSDKGKGKEVVGPFVNMTEEGARLVTSRGIAIVVTRKTQMLVVQESVLRTNPKTKVDAIAWWIDSVPQLMFVKIIASLRHMNRWKTDLYFTWVMIISLLFMEKENLISGPVLNKCGYKQVYESDKYILSKSGVFVGLGYYNNVMFMLNLNKVPNDLGSVYMSSSTVVNWAVVRLPDPKRKTLGEKGIDCIFVGYAEHSKAYMFYVIEPNDSVSINSIIESRDAIFDENRFSLIPRPKDIIPNSNESQRDDHSDDIPSEVCSPQMFGNVHGGLPETKPLLHSASLSKKDDRNESPYSLQGKESQFDFLKKEINHVLRLYRDLNSINDIAMAEEDAFLVDNVEGGLCVDYTDAIIVGRCYSGRDKDKGKELWDSLESKYMEEDSSRHVHYKRMLEMSKDDLIPVIDENPEKCTTCMLTKITRQPFKSITRKSVILELIHSDLCDFHATPSLGNKKYVITSIDDAYRFCYVYLLHAKNEALDKFRIYKTEVELQQNDLIKTLRTDRGGEYYDPVFFQSIGIIHETTAPYTPQLNGVAERKNRALKEMVNSMLSYSGLSEGFWGEAMLTACYLLNRVPNKRNKTTPYELWPKDVIPNSDEPQKDDHSDDVPSETPEPRRVLRRILEPIMKLCPGFWKEAIDDEIGSIINNNTWVLSDLPLGCKPLGCKWIFKRKMKGEGTIDKFKDRLNKGIVITQSYYIEKILKKFNREDCSPVSTLVDPVEKIKPNRGKHVDQLEYSRAIGCLMYVMTSTRPDIAYAVGRLSRFIINPSRQHWHAITRVFKYLKGTMNYGLSYVGYPSVLEAYSDASWINHVEDSSSTSGWVFLLGGGSISWASKKQTCITGSTMESEFVALDAASKEVEWLRNFIHEIPIWLKPITLISIHCDSVATLAKASSQIYNGKSRHLGVRHSMVRELIMNGVISIEFVRSQHNLADHLMNGLARDLVIKSVIEMGLKSI
ncbi:zinc finger, CCHC-type containing protein [Tanacetum coccineum]|uniref:Zinc finger, CCHC-type containing protein n=1 Tax=Tanacetum coccineum TaxID=301880 RepID=A0ABQ5EUY1_9ASTR